jgi:flagellar hook-associated protein 1 FlgK
MSISQALNTSLSGLRATQAGLALVASNVANAQTPGYVRKSLNLATSTAGDGASSVVVAGINRELDQYLQRQMRVETAGGSYADLRSSMYQQLQAIYGQPGSDSALETLYSNFTNSVQALVTSPDSTAAQTQVLSNGQVLSQSLNGMTSQIQALRSDAENGLADAVATANTAMQQIVQLNTQLSGKDADNTSDAALMDQRDTYIDQLSQLMDIRVVINDQNQASVFTNSGVQLVGVDASHLAFNPQGTVTPATQWSANPSQSTLGTLTLVSGTGSTIDLIANHSIRSGKIAALVDMRDNVLVQAQNQLDGLAAAMSQALSDQTVPGGTASAGLQTGFSVNTTGVLDGNTINLTYTDTSSHTQHNVTIVRVDDASALPLGNAATTNPNDEVIGLDFSGGLSAVASQLNTLFGGKLQFSAAGSVLTVLDDGAGNLADVNALSVTQTATSLTGGAGNLPFFTDGGDAYTGAISASGSQMTGLAGRIAVNSTLLGDPSKLVLYAPGTATGDPTRPNFIYNQLTGASLTFSPQSGLGTASTPFAGSLPAYLQQVLSMQGGAAANAQNLAQGQDVVVNALQARVNDASGVNVDQEMAYLITLQTAYGANARVMSVAQQMINALLQMGM